jgi:hypothetical protein
MATLFERFVPSRFDFRPTCLFPLQSRYPNYPAWGFTVFQVWNRWAKQYRRAKKRLIRNLAPSSGLQQKAGNLLSEATKTGYCFWAWNALATWPPLTDHADLWRWCGNWSGILDHLEGLGTRWEGSRDFFSLRFWDTDGSLEEKACFINKSGLWENDPSCLAPSTDANLINAARPLLQEDMPSAEEWGNWQKRLFWLQFNDWQKPDKKAEPLPWIPDLPRLTMNRPGFLSAVCRMTWECLRRLEGTNRPQEPEAKDFQTIRQALDEVVRWCEPYLPTGLSEPTKLMPQDVRVNLLRWECGNTKRLIDGLSYVQERSKMPQDYDSAVMELWAIGKSCFGPRPSDKKPIADKDQALQAVGAFESALRTLESSHGEKGSPLSSKPPGGDPVDKGKTEVIPHQTDDPRLEQLLEACGNAELIISGLKNVQDYSHIQQDFESLVKKLWEQAWWYSGVGNRPPELPIPIKNEVEARNYLGSLERWATSRKSHPSDIEVGNIGPAMKKEAEARHSLDFRSVHWYGTDYCFTANQATCIKVLWQAWENKTPEIADATVLEEADVQVDRLDLVFRGNPAWGTMIKPGRTKGTHRLSIPE